MLKKGFVQGNLKGTESGCDVFNTCQSPLGLLSLGRWS